MHSSQAACTVSSDRASPQGGDSQVSSCSAPSSSELFLQKSGLTFTFLEAAEGHGFVTRTDFAGLVGPDDQEREGRFVLPSARVYQSIALGCVCGGVLPHVA